jgi:serine/threonine-protein kinase RsbW
MSGLHMFGEFGHVRDAMIWLDTQCAAHHLTGDDASRLAIVLEELLVNLAAYGGSPPPSVELSFRRESQALQLTVEDDGIAFDPTHAPPPNLSDDVDERAVGSLGIHLVMRLMDEVSYSRAGEHNRLVLRKFVTST